MNILSISLVCFLLFDQLLALATPFSSGLGLSIFMGLLAITSMPKAFKQPNKVSDLLASLTPVRLIVMVLIVIYSLIASINAPCNDYFSFSLTTTFLVVLTWGFLNVYTSNFEFNEVIEPTHALVGLVVIFLFLCMATMGFDLYSILKHSPTNRPSGLYLEPSHIALFASPLIFTVIKSQQTRIFGILLTVFISVLAFTLTNLALTGLVMVCYILHSLFSGHWKVAKTNGFLIMFMAILLFAFTLHSSYLRDRLETTKETKNGSMLVYLNGWLLAESTILHTNGLGLGPGAMGCSEAINNDPKTLSARPGVTSFNGEIICVRSGSFLASKVISELGWLGIIVVALLCYQLARVFISALSFEFDLLLVGSLCLTATLFFIRGVTYFSAPTVFCILMLFCFKSNRSKSLNWVK